MSRILQWSILMGAVALVTGALPAVAADKQAQHRRHLGRRHRPVATSAPTP